MGHTGFTYELRDESQAEANVVVAVVRVVGVAVRHPAVLRIVVPATAANNTVRTLDECPIFFTQTLVLAPSAGMPVHQHGR